MAFQSHKRSREQWFIACINISHRGAHRNGLDLPPFAASPNTVGGGGTTSARLGRPVWFTFVKTGASPLTEAITNNVFKIVTKASFPKFCFCAWGHHSQDLRMTPKAYRPLNTIVDYDTLFVDLKH